MILKWKQLTLAALIAVGVVLFLSPLGIIESPQSVVPPTATALDDDRHKPFFSDLSDAHTHKSSRTALSSVDVCEHLRRTLRGKTTAELSGQFLPEMYRQHRLMPSQSRLVMTTSMPWKSVGLCNVRTMVLDYLVLAALVGADVVLPKVPSLVLPGSSPIAHQLEGYFDVQHLRSQWKRFCPSMTLYHNRRKEGSSGPFLEDLEGGKHGVLIIRQPLGDKVRVGSTRSDQDAVANNVEKRLNEMDVGIRRWLKGAPRHLLMKRRDDDTAGADIQKRNTTATQDIVVVNVKKWHLWDWSMPLEDTTLENLRRSIGDSLRSPQYITRVAERVVNHLKALGEQYGSGQRFCAAHLRSEVDMQHMGDAANGTRLTNQYLDAAVAAGKKQCAVLYVAAGTREHLDRFTALAAPLGIVMITLGSLKKTTAILSETSGWTYSQSAVLEYEILAAAHKFFGASVSSFSWNLAIRRYFAQTSDATSLRHIIHPHLSIPYDDPLSTLYFGGNQTADANHEHRALQGMWP
ncbi:membrane-associated protein, putative [Bodo saltans]|uniref:Membrane-associated protein, putative n=1 Tax=Bodo saltans TaxID=75058 RepID=A0A0S4JN07_BODSA|nr:membrane-associated protein, putative [Bodo saltans]|eukprot:CUG90499.1 membrane-associated protein, putative [Bodo saltans]